MNKNSLDERNRRFSPILDGKINPDFEGRI